MNQIDDGGFKTYVHNPSPDFFDISRVFRPADRTGYTLKKVAYVHEVRLSADLAAEQDALASKSAASQKLSDIDKIIRAEPMATSTLSPDEKSFIVKFKNHADSKLAAAPSIKTAQFNNWPLREVLSAAHACGVVLKDAEFIELATTKLAGYPLSLEASTVNKVAEAGRWALAAFAECPSLLDELINNDILETDKVASELIDAFKTISEKRAYAGEMLYRRLVPEGLGIRPDAAPTTDILHTPYGNTTRGAAIDAQDAVTRAHIGKVLGGTGLLLGGYKALTAFPSMRKFKAPIAIGAAMLGAHTLGKRPGGVMPTAEGFDIPDITELSTKTATVSQAAIVHLIECSSSPRTGLDFSNIKLSCIDEVAEGLGRLILP
jgi:hypothetical protein